MRFIQFRGFFHSIALIRGKYDSLQDRGDISHFKALCAALSATIGTGNIAGVATAIVAGGPGAVFWMWVTALVGMAIKFTSCTLAVKYRIFNEDGSLKGGPFYYIEHGLGKGFKPLALLFAICTAIATLGIGNMVQSNSVADAFRSLFAISSDGVLSFNLFVGFSLALMTAAVIIGGIKRIAGVASLLVPFMTIAYIGGALFALLSDPGRIIYGLKTIVSCAFTGTAPIGGFLGSTVMYTVRMGVARGIFSNESGLGTAPMIHANARTEEPVREGIVAMIGPFIDTILICTMTALVIISSDLWHQGSNGAALTAASFEYFLPDMGHVIVSGGLSLFAYSTLITWYYYGEKGVEYLLGKNFIKPYKCIYIAAIPLGAVVRLQVVWGFSDIANALMAVPNVVAILGLSGVVLSEMNDYFERMGKG